MDTTAGLEGSVVPFGLGLVYLVPDTRRVAIIGGLDAREAGPRVQPSDDTMAQRPSVASSLVADSPTLEARRDASDAVFDSALVLSDAELANIEGESLDWTNVDIDFTDFLNTQTNYETLQYPPSGWSSARHTTTRTNKTFHMQQVLSSVDKSIPPNPSSTIRFFDPRPKMNIGQQRIANLILHNLKSYPLMMMRHDGLPPFIHRRLTTFDAGNTHMEPLANCLNLVHMISGGVQYSRKLFWKNVGLECERLIAEHLILNKWELLGAIQALSIYILLRLNEGQTDHNNYDSLLLTAVGVITQQLSRIDITGSTQFELANHGLEKDWTEWIYEESRRRLAVIYQALDMLVYLERSPGCFLQVDLILAPLPAKKQLWEASDALTWKAEIERNSCTRTAFGLAANGELVTLDEGQLYGCNGLLSYKSLDAKASSSSGVSNWEEWCAGMDGLGGLVMLAASLIV
ncbi:hypothetical protein K505DRAFT_247236 [Melanomma pulvis-pyrius CBS 109.77]|uniref:Transcription factor domain-containing protein n=1 Tax=Melanomma pulvis-pyrius CBS 109.77 TaxID=1314802 RepID=A0A6A6X785_9PLEO|nr:hypothetical protein K505DRAFT_247236 [Melanomma pulvis-pyrius CBS 109.77]